MGQHDATSPPSSRTLEGGGGGGLDSGFHPPGVSEERAFYFIPISQRGGGVGGRCRARSGWAGRECNCNTLKGGCQSPDVTLQLRGGCQGLS